MEYIILIGLAAAVCTTGSFLPQALKTIKTNSVKDLSSSMYTILFVGTILWVLYGILISDVPLIIANGITLLLAGIILFKIKSVNKK